MFERFAESDTTSVFGEDEAEHAARERASRARMRKTAVRRRRDECDELSDIASTVLSELWLSREGGVAFRGEGERSWHSKKLSRKVASA